MAEPPSDYRPDNATEWLDEATRDNSPKEIAIGAVQFFASLAVALFSFEIVQAVDPSMINVEQTLKWASLLQSLMVLTMVDGTVDVFTGHHIPGLIKKLKTLHDLPPYIPWGERHKGL